MSLKEISEHPSLWLQNISIFAQNEQMVTLLNRTFQRKSKGEGVPAATSHWIMIWLAGVLMHCNAQHPGAVANATLQEYEAATTFTHGRETYKTIMVSCHMTGTTGCAKLTADSHLSRQLDLYVHKLWPTLKGSETGLLFPNREGKPIDHLSRHISRLAQLLWVDMPKTATETRHPAATAVADRSEAERENVATAMSHSVRTKQLYYRMKKRRRDAVEGYRVMEEVWREEESGRGSGERTPFTKQDSFSILQPPLSLPPPPLSLSPSLTHTSHHNADHSHILPCRMSVPSAAVAAPTPHSAARRSALPPRRCSNPLPPLSHHSPSPPHLPGTSNIPFYPCATHTHPSSTLTDHTNPCPHSRQHTHLVSPPLCPFPVTVGGLPVAWLYLRLFYWLL